MCSWDSSGAFATTSRRTTWESRSTCRTSLPSGRSFPSGNVALVTGASRGIGAACARRLAADGWAVGLTFARAAGEAEAVADEIRADGGDAEVFRAEQRDQDGARALLEECEQRLGRPRAVVANAGVTRDTLAVRMSGEQWRDAIETNLIGTARILDHAITCLRSGGGGSIVVLSSIVGRVGNAGQANYAASKAGLIGLVRDLARAHGPDGIRVNAVAPGYITTRLTDEIPDDLREGILAATALGRLGQPEDVSGPVSFLCADTSSFVTGSVLAVDGGLSL